MNYELRITNREQRPAENYRPPVIFGFPSFFVPQGRSSALRGATLVLFLLFSYFPLLTLHFGLVAEAATIKAPPSNLGLVGYWPMNEGVGTIAGDMSGAGHTGTFSGTPTWTMGKRGGALTFG